jgi:cytochrome c553
MSLFSLPKRSTLACNGMLRADASAATGPTASIQHGRQLAQACAACHGPDGNSRGPDPYPNLAAQAAAYLELQLATQKRRTTAGRDEGHRHWAQAGGSS